MLGIGAMLGRLTSNESSVNAINRAIGQKIEEINLSEDQLSFVMTDGFKLGISDEGQSCCEHRYMTSDDDLQHYVGAELLGAEVRDAPSKDEEYGDHDCAFLIVHTSKGDFTITNHNEHNGYYGGFDIRCTAL